MKYIVEHIVRTTVEVEATSRDEAITKALNTDESKYEMRDNIWDVWEVVNDA